MKQFIFHTSIILLFFIILIYPESAFSGACSGLLLWFNTVLPTLFPFLLLSNLLLNTSAIDLLVRIISPLLCKLFCVSPYGSFAILCGFLCGYPIGAKLTSDLLLSNKISKSEAGYLLSFCNNTSPMFIISYVVHQKLNSPELSLPTLMVLSLSPIICSFIFRRFYHQKNIYASKICTQKSATNINNLFDHCIMNSFETITKVGGYIIIFSVFIKILSDFPFQNTITNLFLSCFEITTGISLLSSLQLPFKIIYIYILTLTSFGGWCSIAQTYSIVKESTLSISVYIIEKLVTALVTSLLSIIVIQYY